MGTWQEQAMCAVAVSQGWATPDDFFDGDVNLAKRICTECPVQMECYQLVESLPVYQQNFGIWGGVSARTRRDRRTWTYCKRCGDRIPKRTKLCEPCKPLAKLEYQRAYDQRRRVRA